LLGLQLVTFPALSSDIKVPAILVLNSVIYLFESLLRLAAALLNASILSLVFPRADYTYKTAYF